MSLQQILPTNRLHVQFAHEREAEENELIAAYERVAELERLVRQARAIMTSGDLREDFDSWLASADEALASGVRS